MLKSLPDYISLLDYKVNIITAPLNSSYECYVKISSICLEHHRNMILLTFPSEWQRLCLSLYQTHTVCLSLYIYNIYKEIYIIYLHTHTHTHIWGFPGGVSGKEPTYQCKRHKRCRFDPWVRKIPWRRHGNHSSILAWRIPWTEKPGGL